MRFHRKEEVKMLREKYNKGDTVELVHMDDIQSPPVGTKGKVMFVDDTGTIHVNWENGSSLGVVFGIDVIRKVKEN